ncbi:unnamed protein product [Spirodela intermedia]|uniref:Uncharacterized protein n=1 Tax=Spirodela intermedia TaxID=51605 RepID=A0A7I8L4C6_SPIIN|nr:unnamed protein product [Spirodela intermedia]
MEEPTKRRSVSPFGSWNYCDDRSAGRRVGPSSPPGALHRRGGRLAGGVGRVYLHHTPHYSFYAQDAGNYRFHDQPPAAAAATLTSHVRKARRVPATGESMHQQAAPPPELQKKKKNKRRDSDSDAGTKRPPRRAIDEDLYKVPPELLYEKPRRNSPISELWRSCLCLNST